MGSGRSLGRGSLWARTQRLLSVFWLSVSATPLFPPILSPSFLITCPSYLPPPTQVPVSQTPAAMMPNARRLARRHSVVMSSNSMSVSASKATRASIVRPVSIWGLPRRGEQSGGGALTLSHSPGSQAMSGAISPCVRASSG